MLSGMDVFASYVLPILMEMSEVPLKSFPLQRRIRELGITDDDESTRLIDLMINNGLIAISGGKNGSGVWYVVHDVYLTPKGLAQLNLWPSDDERGLFLLGQVGRRARRPRDRGRVERRRCREGWAHPNGRSQFARGNG